jgi:hypothetical protein
MIRSLAVADALTLIVGAGVSVEAGLPAWRTLLERLLDRAARERLTLADDRVRSDFVAEILNGETALGAAAVAEALAEDDLATWISPALYGDDPAAFRPGPIVRQIVELRRVFGLDLRILTTNYDDLIEQGFADSDLGVVAEPYADPERRAASRTDGRQDVVHLHGYLPRSGDAIGDIVLTEDDYQQVATDDWQSTEVGHALTRTTCLFIGSSLTDPNLLRYLYRHVRKGSPQHYAIFTRQGTYKAGTPRELIAAREVALTRRWQQRHVEVVFVDHYVEIAQALAEIALARDDAQTYITLPERLAGWHEVVAGELLVAEEPAEFAVAQDALHDALRDALRTAVDTAAHELDTDPGDEVLGATLWLVDRDGTHLTSWAMTDRAHRDPRTVDPVPIDEFSQWVAVRAFTRGAMLAEPRNTYASRWRYIRGLPLVTTGHLPVGVITVSSMSRESDTFLNTMPDGIAASFDAAIQASAVAIIESATVDG